MNATEITNEILNGNWTSDEIRQMWDGLSTAQKLSRARRTAIAMTTMRIGATGVLTGLRPKSLNGIPVKVVEIKQTRVTVQELDADGNPKTSFNSRYRVPAQCVRLNA